MKLLNSLYHIRSKAVTDAFVRYDIHLDASHFIYQAHFPGEPITPGVCVIQIAKELMEDHLHQALTIKAVKNVKFLSVISPVDNRQVTFAFEKIVVDDTAKTYKAQVQVLSGETLLAKLSFVLKND